MVFGSIQYKYIIVNNPNSGEDLYLYSNITGSSNNIVYYNEFGKSQIHLVLNENSGYVGNYFEERLDEIFNYLKIYPGFLTISMKFLVD